MRSLPVQQWAVLRAREQVIWICWVEVDFPHCAWNKEKSKWNIINHKSANGSKRIKKKMHLYAQLMYLTFCRVSLHEWQGCFALSYVPDTQHAILPSCGHNVLLVGVSVYTMQRDTIPESKNKQMNKMKHNPLLEFSLH